ncbi:MAG: FliA/WhiG family RNA polymerase sigma factor [Lachnospiraceae bacterium]|nr:FliA/WhiG family RNA polymerase sigma factor [Lachnospiraceae bacterium]
MNEAGKKELWDLYTSNRSPELREQIIIEYAPLVKLVAGRLSMYLGYVVEYDDLVGYGIFGLIDAIDKFDNDKSVKFETYASLRIRGAILDHIRKMDWIPRTLRQKQKRMETAIKELETELGRNATDAEVAKRIGITESELVGWQSQMKITNIISLNEYMDAETEAGYGADIPDRKHFTQPEKAAEDKEIKGRLLDALELLTDKEKKVILLYYYEELTLKEISEILGVSESRVSQLHTRALQKMKKKLGNYTGIFSEVW